MNQPTDPWNDAMREAAAATTAPPEAMARVRARLDAPPAAGIRWPVVVSVGAIGPLVMGLLVIGTSGFGGFDRPANANTQPTAAQTKHIDWVVGTVTAAPGTLTTIATPEAVWQGTEGGSVTRDRLGTHGDDSLQCEGAELRVSGGITCLPTTASAWLGRGHALVENGDTESAQQAYENASTQGEGLVQAEAFAALADRYVRQQDYENAAHAAEAALATGASPREEHLHRLAARAHLLLKNCAAVVPHLEAVPDEESAYAARCSK